MINYKLKYNLTGPENWPQIASVFAKGIPAETSITSQDVQHKKQTEVENTIQFWKNIVVLKATSQEPTEFYIGFTNLGTIQYLKHELKTDLEFGMRIGGDDVRIFILPKDLSQQIKLEIIEYTNEDDQKYENLILI